MDITSLIQITLPGLGTPTIASLFAKILPYVYVVAGFALLAFLVYGGLQIMMSQGDPKAVAAGKDKIQNALVGFIIMFLAYMIVNIIGRILGLPAINNIFGS